jgi:UDP-N-acetylglucosamine 4,6-dehydratase/5-epimerase
LKNVLITGGAGYLGRAYLRWARQYRPDLKFTIFSRDEGKHARCRREFPEHRYVIGDVRDPDSVDLAIAGHDTVIHAAAFKYVPQGETNVAECHEINVVGSLNVARAAARHGVERVIGISTDKACSPINVYGHTKALMERIFQEYDAKTSTQFNLVRYGNVISSTGSVIPIFRQQLKDQGFVTLTDPEMTRFWLPVSDAVTLINLALSEPYGGTILIPRCPSISMQALASAVTDKVKVIGLRFGEKRHESLLNAVEAKYVDPFPIVPYFTFQNKNPHAMRLYPTTYQPQENNMVAYSSDNPDHILTAGELLKMIEEAPE